MRVKFKVGGRAEDIGWNTVKLFGLVVVVGALISSSSRGVMKPAPSSPKTVIPANIRAAVMDSLTVPFGARVVQVFVAPGTEVKAGQPIALLESDEVRQQVQAAQRRFAIAQIRSKPASSRQATPAETLQRRAARRSLDIAKQRLAADSLTDAESVYAAAKAKRDKIALLVAQQMATSVELDGATREALNELRNLRAAQERHSRLEQEAESYETQLAVLEAQSGAQAGAGGAAAGADLELADARAAVEAANHNVESLQVKAPRDGVVLSSVPSVGDRVFAGSPIVHIADVSRLSFEAPVSAVIARQIRPGSTVRLRVPTEPPRQVVAEVSSVSLAPDPIQQSYVVRAVISNPDRNVILVGMEGAMEFPHGESLWRRLF